MLVCTVCLHEGCRLRDGHMLRGRCTPGAWDLPRYPRREGGRISINGDRNSRAQKTPRAGRNGRTNSFIAKIPTCVRREASFKRCGASRHPPLRTARLEWRSRVQRCRHARGTSVATARSASISSAVGCERARCQSSCWPRRASLQESAACR